MSSPLFFSLLCLFVFFFNTTTSIKCVGKVSTTTTQAGDKIEQGIKQTSEAVKMQAIHENFTTANDELFKSVILYKPLHVLAEAYTMAHGKVDFKDVQNKTQLHIQSCGIDCSPETALYTCEKDFCNKDANDPEPKEEFMLNQQYELQMEYIVNKAAETALSELFGYKPNAEIEAKIKKLKELAYAPPATTTTTTTTTAPARSSSGLSVCIMAAVLRFL